MSTWHAVAQPVAELDQLAASIVAQDLAPEAAVGAARWDATAPALWLGGARDRLFDLASLTKPMTAVAIARAGLSPHAPLRTLLPELAYSASGDARLDLLLSHRAGLVPHVPLYLPLQAGARAVDADHALWIAANARREPCSGPIPAEGFAPAYSDLGYLLAGRALARSQGTRDAGAALVRWLIEPLGLRGQLGSARQLGPNAAYVPTEVVPWRTPDAPTQPLCGVVHDENSYALNGLGASGHAGLFGTVEACLRFGLAVLGMMRAEGPLKMQNTPDWLWRPRPGGTFRASFDGKSAEGSSAGQLASAASLGHLGFTGTSLWLDPEQGAVVCVLCNRVNPSRSREPAASGLRAQRPLLHDALWRFVAARR